VSAELVATSQAQKYEKEIGWRGQMANGMATEEENEEARKKARRKARRRVWWTLTMLQQGYGDE